MIESTRQLRKICQDTRENSSYKIGWTSKRLYRSLSIYITRLFLMLGISANQATLVSLIIGIIAGILLVSGNPMHWIIGAFVVYLCSLIDHVDGEIARYRRTSSKPGEYLDALVGFGLFDIYLPVCISFGLFNSLRDIRVFGLGFVILASKFLLHGSGLLAQTILLKTSFSYEDLMKAKKSNLEALVNLGMLVFGEWLTVFLLIAAIIDVFVTPWTIGRIPFIGLITVNARSIHLAIYGVATLLAASLRIVHNLRFGSNAISI